MSTECYETLFEGRGGLKPSKIYLRLLSLGTNYMMSVAILHIMNATIDGAETTETKQKRKTHSRFILSSIDDSTNILQMHSNCEVVARISFYKRITQLYI